MAGYTTGIGGLCGNKILQGAAPLAQAYAGHQFGHLTMLGDGRAILLGEQITALGERFDIELKDSGQTPYSRGGDGRAVLGPMLREYIISEAMWILGIPTIRSLAVVTTATIKGRMQKLLRALDKPYEDSSQQQELSKLPGSEFCHYQTFCGT